ncbi:hypothetical protein [Acidovorax soli]|uniref:hypothetical protein n=1 Tax=Acidovorax soli TaxID=592050 RepID=UPI001C87AFA1|nr:hypothetical protein [Acidovorax soli]
MSIDTSMSVAESLAIGPLTRGRNGHSLLFMLESGPVILGLSVSEWAELVRRATREAARENLRAGIPVTGMVNGIIRVTYPTDALALELLKDEPTIEHPPEPKA